MATTTQASVAFIVPVFNEEAVLPLFYEELVRVLSEREDLEPEFIFVNDGSTDGSAELIRSWRENDKRITLIEFSGNRGQQLALTAGLDYASFHGHAVVVLMDSDLQDPPTVALQLVDRVLSGADMAYAQRASSNGHTITKRATSDLFYYALGKLAEINIPARTSDFRAANAAVVAEVVKYREHSRFLRGIFSHVGFTQEAIQFQRPERAAGKSKYSYTRLLKLALDALMGYSTWPLRAISSLGIVVSILTVILGIALMIYKVVEPDFAVYGWASTTLIISFFAGLQLLTLGIMGSYIGRIYIQNLERPLYSIKSLERG